MDTCCSLYKPATDRPKQGTGDLYVIDKAYNDFRQTLRAWAGSKAVGCLYSKIRAKP